MKQGGAPSTLPVSPARLVHLSEELLHNDEHDVKAEWMRTRIAGNKAARSCPAARMVYVGGRDDSAVRAAALA